MYTVDNLDSFIFLKVLSQICRKTNGSIRYIIKNINYVHVNFVKDWIVPLVPWMVQALSVAGFIKLVIPPWIISMCPTVMPQGLII